jgi:hypothetical protein
MKKSLIHGTGTRRFNDFQKTEFRTKPTFNDKRFINDGGDDADDDNDDMLFNQSVCQFL